MKGNEIGIILLIFLCAPAIDFLLICAMKKGIAISLNKRKEGGLLETKWDSDIWTAPMVQEPQATQIIKRYMHIFRFFRSPNVRRKEGRGKRKEGGPFSWRQRDALVFVESGDNCQGTPCNQPFCLTWADLSRRKRNNLLPDDGTWLQSRFFIIIRVEEAFSVACCWCTLVVLVAFNFVMVKRVVTDIYAYAWLVCINAVKNIWSVGVSVTICYSHHCYKSIFIPLLKGLFI